ncbi:MAG: BatA domain-containing protein [Planctomycetota bacterium]
MLIGAAGGAIPIIIHLLNRRRFKIVRWAAMEFLLASLKKNYKRLRMQNLLLLLLRVLIVVLLALALARPMLPQSGVVNALGRPGRHAVIVVDNSMSARYRQGDDTTFERAQAIGESIVDSLGEGDVVSVLVMSDIVDPVIKEPTADLGLAKRTIERLAPGWGGTDVRGALVAAAELFDLSGDEKPRKDVYLITDMQATGWGTKDQAPSDELAAALETIAERATVFVVDKGPGSRRPENLAVVGLEADSQVVGVGRRVTFTAAVRNLGSAAKKEVHVNFFVDNFNQGNRKIDEVAPGETETVTFGYSFNERRAYVVHVRIDDDRLPADNVRYLAVNAGGTIPVLLVNGDVATKPKDNETYYLERALQPPREADEPALSNISPTTWAEFDLAGGEFGRFSAVVLANIASVSDPKTVARLERYVRLGGTLIVFLGDRVSPDSYNEQLFKGGEGLLPVELGEEVLMDPETARGRHLILEKDPMYVGFRTLDDVSREILEKFAIFTGYIRMTPGEEATVAARFEGGDPAVVAKGYGRGSVVVCASSADTAWNNLGETGALMMLMHELIGQVAVGEASRRNLIVRSPYRRIFEPGAKIESVRITPPGETGEPTSLTPFDRDKAPKIVFEKTDTAGAYKLEFTVGPGADARPAEYFSVNPAAEESDLGRYSPAEAKEAVEGLEFEYATDEAELHLRVEASRSRRDIARALLLAVLAMACLELVLGQRFGR